MSITSSSAKSVSDGALAQLGAIGGEEKYTTCAPEHTFFVQSYRRHTPFAIGQLDYCFEQNVTSLSQWSGGKCLTAKVPKHGDLLVGSYFRAILKRLYINSGVIDRQSFVNPAVFDGQSGTAVSTNINQIELQPGFSTTVNFYAGYNLVLSGGSFPGTYPITSYDGNGFVTATSIGGDPGPGIVNYEIQDPSVGDATLYEGDEDLQLHWCNEVGHALVQQAVWKVGQTPIDAVTSEVMHCYHEKCNDDSQLLRDAIGRLESSIELQTFSAVDRQLYVPLPFTYTQSPQNALPVVALQHDRIEHEITLRGRDDLIVAFDTSQGIVGNGAFALSASTDVQGGELSDLGMMAEFVFLDKPEQRAYCDAAFEKYFEFTQGCGAVPHTVSVAADATTATISNLGYNHSITSLWAFYRADAEIAAGASELNYFNFSTGLAANYQPQRTNNSGANVTGLNRFENPFESIELSVNSAPRVSRPGVYWQELGAYQKRVARRGDNYIMVYSFALDACCGEAPSGALNIGRFAQTPITFNLTKSNDAATGIEGAGKIFVFARTQGVYKIAGGKLGLAWSTI